MNLTATFHSGESKELITERISRETAIEYASKVLSENWFFVLSLSDSLSNVDFGDYGDQSRFFIEQYYDSIYGGIYTPEVANHVINFIFDGCTSDQLKALFPSLEGELVYES